MNAFFAKEIAKINQWPGLRPSGVVTQVIGLLIESKGPLVHLGELCTIYDTDRESLLCEVVGFKEDKIFLMSLGEMTKIAPGSEVYPSGKVHRIAVSHAMCGRVLDALGNPIDGKGPIAPESYYPLMEAPPRPMQRKLITEKLTTGIKAIDAACTLGLGQRMGIFSGSGLGKSRLLGMIARKSTADINVIGLIGERGREVLEFIERELGPEGLSRSVVVAVTSDEPALLRTKGAHTAAAIAEYFRNAGKNVVFLMDSITRYAMALREIGLAVGEPPTTRGYTPSVFAMLPKLLERSGSTNKGIITGIYTVLVEGDDVNDPVADSVRAILDGHIVLSKALASANHYPAIDVLNSLSRMMSVVVEKEPLALAAKLRDLLQTYKEAEDLVNIGAYAKGANPLVDEALAKNQAIKQFLRQKNEDFFSYEETISLLKRALNT